ncbi:MAG TPA: hypothetical protein VG125_32415 [Pirellulales bacterium]|jgi:hypothetical protein|nr:hypothetical protein [Pirellulales bacterium]
MICKISINVTGTQAGNETSASCELTCHGDKDTVRACAAEIRVLQEACLAAVAAEEAPALDRPVDGPHRPGKAIPTLCQLARLYRAATKVAFFDLAKLQDVCHKLYQKPLEELSMLEVGGVIGTLNAVVKGMVDVKHVLGEPAPAINGRAGRVVV